MTTRVPISNNDFGLFDAELNNYEYEYFFKHIGAFKRFMQEEVGFLVCSIDCHYVKLS